MLLQYIYQYFFENKIFLFPLFHFDTITHFKKQLTAFIFYCKAYLYEDTCKRSVILRYASGTKSGTTSCYQILREV